MIKRIVFSTLLLLALFIGFSPTDAFAQRGQNVIGEVKPPKGVADYNAQAQLSGGEIGIILFASRVIIIVNVIAGLFIIYNFLVAGFTYVTSAGDSAAHAKVRDRLTFSLVGLLVVVSSYTLAGVVGLIFFGDAAFILSPELQGALP